MSFALHPQLIKDCIGLGDLTLCRVLLMNNRFFPWLVLVPKIKDASELMDLKADQRAVLIEEINHLALALKRATGADKMNIATLGNQVPQLHLHIIARFRQDPAWPNPVWGGAVEPYPSAELAEYMDGLRRALGLTAVV